MALTNSNCLSSQLKCKLKFIDPWDIPDILEPLGWKDAIYVFTHDPTVLLLLVQYVVS